MKKILIGLILVSMVSVGQAQNDAISKFFSKYQDDPDFTHVIVTGKMFSLFTHFEPQDEEEEALKEAMTKIEGLKILAAEDSEKGKDLYKEASSLIPANEYEELMSVRDDDGDFRFLIKETGGKISELLMVGGRAEDFFILSLVGEIDLAAISKLSRHVNIDGFEHFRKLDKDDEHDDDNDEDDDDDGN